MSSTLPDAAEHVVRRAPFSDNPRVGARGQRTQQRILDAALRAFGDEGYHRCSVGRITKLARCSRVSFYQYFASKEDVFHHLAGQVSRQISASTEALDLLTPDRDGWSAMRGWVGRYAEIHTRYEPVFHAYETDEALASFAARTGGDVITRIHSRVTTTTLPSRQLDAIIRLLLQTMNQALGVAGVLRHVDPPAYPRDRVEDAIADVLHRTLFSRHDDVNVHAAPSASPPRTLEFTPAMRDLLRADIPSFEGDGSNDGTHNATLDALLEAGRDVFVRLGYHGTRVDDVVAAAGLSHGGFYRYFHNKAELARILTARANRSTGTVLLEIPDPYGSGLAGSKTALRRWLRRYHAAHAHESAMLRVWVDGVLQDPALRPDYAPPIDWGRRRLVRYLEPRGFGDVDIEALVMVALLGVFGTQPRPPADIEAAAHIIERGLLGR